MKTQNSPDVVRRAADRLEATAARGTFRRRRTMDKSCPETEHLVLSAVQRARSGDEDALRFLYLKYVDNVYGYICSVIRDEHEAEDVTQHLFAKLPTALHRYRPGPVPFSAWLLRVAHNAAIDHVRVRRPMPCEEVRPVDQEDHDAIGRDRYHDLREAFDTLPTDQRNVMMLRFIVGLTPGEIAEAIGRTEDAIHGLQHRGRRAVKAELQRLGAAPAALATA
jgi:RNA polymerase sigma-70 factor (ECF subfamily)